MEEISVSIEVLRAHFVKYTFSLRPYADQYLPLFGLDPVESPIHVAYLCPLCLKNGIVMIYNQGVIVPEDLTLDHFPPKSVGGQFSVMVCKKCNNDAGSAYDFALKEKIQNLAFNNKVPDATLISKSQMTNVTGKYPAKLIINKNRDIELELKPNKKICAPYLDSFIEYSKTNSDYKIDISFWVANEHKVMKALIKTTYLFCFEAWGYEFIFSSTGEKMRRMLLEEKPEGLPYFWLGNEMRGGRIERMPVGVCFIQQPAECRCFVVNIPIEDKETGFYEIAAVLVPGPEQQDWAALKHIQATMVDQQLNVTLLHVAGNMLDDGTIDGYSRSWRLFQ